MQAIPVETRSGQVGMTNNMRVQRCFVYKKNMAACRVQNGIQNHQKEQDSESITKIGAEAQPIESTADWHRHISFFMQLQTLGHCVPDHQLLQVAEGSRGAKKGGKISPVRGGDCKTWGSSKDKFLS